MEIICITNRHLAAQNYMKQIEQIAQAEPKAIIVREKDLIEAEYRQLAMRVMEICAQYQVLCILHTYTDTAIRLGASALHLPLPLLLAMPKEQQEKFSILGASVHSVEEALLAQQAGVAYLLAGHIFATDCKRDIPPRGLPFLKEVCTAVDLPVYALGGIRKENAAACIQAGAQGVCMMSECMQHTDFSKRWKE